MMTKDVLDREKVKEFYADPKTYEMLEAIQKPHGLETLFFIYLRTNTQTGKYSWGFAKELRDEINKEIAPRSISIPDGTFRARADLLEKAGLVKSKGIDPLKRDYTTTPDGDELVKYFMKMFSK